MENSTVVLSRHLALIAYIDRYPGITVDELAAHFGRTSKQIRRDVETLDEAGFGDLLPDKKFELDMDRYLERGELAIFSSLQVKSSPRLTSLEASSLLMGLDLLGPTLSEEVASTVPSILASVLALADDAGTVSPAKVAEPNFTVKTWQLIRQAIQGNQQLRISYISSVQQHSYRRIDPLHLLRTDDGWLLFSWCHAVGASRTFRVDRILSCELLDLAQKHPEKEVVVEGISANVSLRPQAAWRLKELPASRLEQVGDLSVATFQVWSDSWMVSLLLSLAEDVEAVIPDDYRTSACSRAKLALQVWQSFAT